MAFRDFLTGPEARFTRRLVLTILWLALFDSLVPSLVRTLETRRYEGSAPFRFEVSDLFGLGPFVSYLRDHPRGDRPRVVFFGNSIIFGAGVSAADAIPSQYERQRPDVQAFNAAVNGDGFGTSYLIAKEIIDSVDVLYVQVIGRTAHPLLASLIPVDEADARAFAIPAPDPIESRLHSAAGRLWRLYGFHDRLQAAMFGTSTRNFLYLRAKELRSPADPQTPPSPHRDGLIGFRVPRAVAVTGALTKHHEVLRKFAELARARRKRVVFMALEYGGRKVDDAPIAELNALYAPFAEMVVITIPPEVTHDGMHPTPAGCREIASLLLRHERQRGRQ